jgi:hypothetical protein
MQVNRPTAPLLVNRPSTAATIETRLRAIQKEFLHATVVVSTFDNFTSLLEPVKDNIPIITQEIADSAPPRIVHLPSGAAARFRVMAYPASESVPLNYSVDLRHAERSGEAEHDARDDACLGVVRRCRRRARRGLLEHLSLPRQECVLQATQ